MAHLRLSGHFVGHFIMTVLCNSMVCSIRSSVTRFRLHVKLAMLHRPTYTRTPLAIKASLLLVRGCGLSNSPLSYLTTGHQLLNKNNFNGQHFFVRLNLLLRYVHGRTMLIATSL